MASSFKEEFKNSKFKKLNKSIPFCQNIPPRSHIDPLHFRKINWLPVSDRVDYCIANTIFKYWNGIVPRYVHEMFKPSLCRCSLRSQMTLDIPPPKKLQGEKAYLFGAKIYGTNKTLVSKMLEYCLLLSMLFR